MPLMPQMSPVQPMIRGAPATTSGSWNARAMA